MYRKPRPGDRSGVLDLDSLMDILSCLVGVMLFLVIYTVLELGAAAYQAEIPTVRARPLGGRQVLVLSNEGTVRVLDIWNPLDDFLSGFEIVRTFDEVPVFVQAAPQTRSDAYFHYALRHENRLSNDLLGTLDLLIEERDDIVGDSIHQLDAGSRYAEILERLDPNETWLAFTVDSTSVDLFRRARDMAVTRGFATEWDLLTLELPLTIPLGGGGLEDLLGPQRALAKPQR
jgi:hypothetical protein